MKPVGVKYNTYIIVKVDLLNYATKEDISHVDKVLHEKQIWQV